MNVVRIPEMFVSVLYNEGSGIYRLVWYKTEHTKSKFVIVKVLQNKFIAIHYLSCIKGSEDALRRVWDGLTTNRKDLSIYHLKDGDIRIMKG